MKVYLCSDEGCCPAVEFKEDGVTIGEGTNMVRLGKDEWNILVAKVKSGELNKI
ncbi:MAG: hypothetical protein H3Z49_05030 [archaeon]|nr:hypothetical protein [archaeon]